MGHWKAVYDNLGAAPPEPHGMSLAYFAVFELGRGLLSMFLYAMMRPYCKPGPKTAAYAGVVAWLAFSITGPAQFIPLGFFSNALWVKAGAYQLMTSIVAAIAGAALYKDPVTPVESPVRCATLLTRLNQSLLSTGWLMLLVGEVARVFRLWIGNSKPD